MIKRKICSKCYNVVWSGGLCSYHHRLSFPEKYRLKSKDTSVVKSRIMNRESKPTIIKKRTKIKSKPRKATGELALFKEIYAERDMKCQVTGVLIPFDVSSFAHILGKGSHPKFRLNPDNIIMVIPRIHTLYDCEGKEKLLKEFPEACIIYEMKEKLLWQYYNV